MVERYLFADEAGCFTFNREPNVSRYFILCTVTTSSLSAGEALGKLRRQLIWEGKDVRDFFHATVEKREVRDPVYQSLLDHKFMIQATICEKAKAQPQVRSDRARFYSTHGFTISSMG
ncbi:MAG: hypothetical protein ACK4N1_02135 [Pseudorhizobium sp.]